MPIAAPGRPEAAYLIERLVDVAAREIGVAPDVLRRRNFIKRAARCRTRPRPARSTTPAISPDIWRVRRSSPTGAGFSGGTRRSKRAGRLRGIGIATYVEACGNNGPDTATLRLEADGAVTVLAGIAVDRAGPPHRLSRRSSPIGSRCRPSACAWSRATPI